MRILLSVSMLVPTLAWVQQHAYQQQLSTIPALSFHSPRLGIIPKQITVLASSPSTDDEASTPEVPDYTGKKIYQRTFYRLFGASLNVQNALVLEERLRFKADPNNPGYILPSGARTFIFRQGTDEDKISDELYRIDYGPNNGPGAMDTTIATILYLASNPDIVQGNILQLSCESGAAGILGCIAANLVQNLPSPSSSSSSNEQESSNGNDENETILTVPHHETKFPPRVRKLTLSEEGQDNVRLVSDMIHDFSTDPKVSLAEVPWSVRIPRRRYQYYRMILGSDIDITYPSARELARVVANSLLPSNPNVLSVLESKSSSSSSGSSFGGLGMDLAEGSYPTSASSDAASEPDPKIPPTFVHICPDVREDLRYLRQFLEKGFKMTVQSDYFRMQRLRFVFQTLPEDADESELIGSVLELQDESNRSYHCLSAIHHPDYTGDGSGEYFFPLESGEYEGGSRSTYLEPEEGGSPW